MSTKPVVVLSGELDIFSLPYLREVLSAVDGPAVIDLSGVRLLTAAALTELHRAAKRAGIGTVTLTGAQPHVRRVLEIVRFEQLFQIAEEPADPAS